MSDRDDCVQGGEGDYERLGEPCVRRLWLVRHGTTMWNLERRLCGHTDVPLADQGHRQARWLAQRLRLEQIGMIYCSDLQRARETAYCIAGLQSEAVPVRISAAWRELAFGRWEGLTYQQIAAEYPGELTFFSDPTSATPPGGETFARMLQRVRSAFADIVREVADLPVGDRVLVSHGGTLRALLCSLLHIPYERQWQLSLDHGSLSAIDVSPGSGDGEPTVSLALLNEQAPTAWKESVFDG